MTFNWFDSQHVFTFYAHSSLSSIFISITDSNSDHKPKNTTTTTLHKHYTISNMPLSLRTFCLLSLTLSHLVFGLVFFMVFGRSFFICLNTQYSTFCDFFARTDIGDNRQQRLRPYNDITKLFPLYSRLSLTLW